MMMNNVSIDSRLTNDVKYKATKDGVPMALFSVANNRGKHTNFFDVVAFGNTADYAHKYLHKAQKVGIVGVLNHNKKYYSIIAKSLDPNRDDGSKFIVNKTNVPKNLEKDVNKASKKKAVKE